jgi:hypothetical protein
VSPALAWRLLAATVLVLVATKFGLRAFGETVLPVLQAAFTWLADDFRVLRFGFFDDRQNVSIGAVVALERAVLLGERVVVPGAVMGTTVTLGTVVQPLQVALVAVLAWPGGWRETLLRLPLVLPPLALVMLADAPLVLCAWLWMTLWRQYAPDGSSLLGAWSVFLNGGGRLVLPLVIGALAIALAARIAKR